MSTIIPKILVLDDDFRDIARILYSQIIKKGEELDRWDVNNLVHLLQLLWSYPTQITNLLACITTRDENSECVIVSMPKDQNGIGNFRVSPVKVCCCLFRWPRLTEIRRIASIVRCKAKLGSGSNNLCLNPYHYQPKLSHCK
ncbi:Dwarfin sma-2 [Thelohanellus kitauei]|uniref:Dwarfin sma-2 n=1 Tax=Thelohanellus kitauei TaxID=669202 RepID=A0A0C2I8W0_THEKT|nr:Dwarfin sma-2 [Thelohanellus kitauei]